MSFDITTIQKGVKDRPRKLLIYGPPKIGKSTLTGSTKNALMIPTEDRVDHIGCDKTKIPKQLEEVFEVIKFLANDKTHKYSRLIIDTIDWLEPLVHDYVCRVNGFKSITDDHNKETAFQKGLKYHAVSGWKQLLEGLDFLRDNGIAVILVAHSTVIKIDPPECDSYDKNVMKIDKNALAVVEEWADVIGYYNREIFVKSEEGKTAKQFLQIEGSCTFPVLRLRSFQVTLFGIDDMEVILDEADKQMEYLLTYTQNKQSNNEKPKTKNEKGEK